VKRFVFVGCFGLFSLLNSFAVAQPYQIPDWVPEQLQRCQEAIAAEERFAAIITIVAIAVGVLGFLAGVLQKWESQRVRKIVLASGMAIGLLTVVQNSAFQATDIRALRRAALESRLLMLKIDRMKADYGQAASLEDRRLLEDRIEEAVDKILRTHARLFTDGTDAANAVSALSIVPTVHAQSDKEPAWVRHPPTRPDKIFHVGIGVNASLAEAKELSLTDALRKAAAAVRERSKASVRQSHPASLIGYIRANSDIENSDYTRVRSGDKTLFRYFTLLEVKKWRLSEQAVQALLETPNVVVPPTRLVQRHVHVLGGEFQRRVAVYVDDIHASRPYSVLVFELDGETARWTESDAIPKSGITRVKGSKRLVEGPVGNRLGFLNFDYAGNRYALTVVTKSALVHDAMEFQITSYTATGADRRIEQKENAKSGRQQHLSSER